MVDSLSKVQGGWLILGLWDIIGSLLCVQQAIRLGGNRLVQNGFPYLQPTLKLVTCLSFNFYVFYPCYWLALGKFEMISLLRTKVSRMSSDTSATLFWSILLQIERARGDKLSFLARKLQRIMSICILTHCSV